eukprot:4300170-Amphidinium_carterae.1
MRLQSRLNMWMPLQTLRESVARHHMFRLMLRFGSWRGWQDEGTTWVDLTAMFSSRVAQDWALKCSLKLTLLAVPAKHGGDNKKLLSHASAEYVACVTHS